MFGTQYVELRKTVLSFLTITEGKKYYRYYFLFYILASAWTARRTALRVFSLDFANIFKKWPFVKHPQWLILNILFWKNTKYHEKLYKIFEKNSQVLQVHKFIFIQIYCKNKQLKSVLQYIGVSRPECLNNCTKLIYLLSKTVIFRKTYKKKWHIS